MTTREHKDVGGRLDGERQREFMNALLDDLRALEHMLAAGMFETGVRRIGAEQELFLINEAWRPARGVLGVLERLRDGIVPAILHAGCRRMDGVNESEKRVKGVSERGERKYMGVGSDLRGNALQ